MNILRKAALGIGTAALLASSTAPAFAAVQHGGDTVLKASTEWNGWGRGRYRHHDRVDGGDILTGIAVLAGIAIIADAATKSDKRDRAPQSYPNDYPDYSSDGRYDNDDGYSAARGNDVGEAVQTCSAAAEQRADANVSEIRSANRDGNGWRVEGDLSNGDDFTCVASDGRVDYIDIGND